MKRSTFFAEKTPCQHDHTHDSRKEASHCNALHTRQALGEIVGLEVSPVFEFVINGAPVKMGNGQKMRFTADFRYCEGGKIVVEDVKASNGHMSRDVPVKLALCRHLWPDIDFRIV